MSWPTSPPRLGPSPDGAVVLHSACLPAALRLERPNAPRSPTMADRSVAALLRHLRQRVDPAAEGLSDCQLVGRFAARRDEAAFETLLRRHGPMVLRLCRSVLRDLHAAEDAFQATFLVLACKASAIRACALPPTARSAGASGVMPASACASLARSRCASSKASRERQRPEGNLSTPTATPTPVSSPGSLRTSPGPSRRWTSMVWC
jgi:hypothetical protein